VHQTVRRAEPGADPGVRRIVRQQRRDADAQTAVATRAASRGGAATLKLAPPGAARSTPPSARGSARIRVRRGCLRAVTNIPSASITIQRRSLLKPRVSTAAASCVSAAPDLSGNVCIVLSRNAMAAQHTRLMCARNGACYASAPRVPRRRTLERTAG